MDVSVPSLTVRQDWRGLLGLEDGVCLSMLALDDPPDEAAFGAVDPARNRRSQFQAGRRCARLALAQAGYGGEALLGAGPDRLPLWPAGWLGSISHTTQAAIAAVAPVSRVGLLGIDMEMLMAERVADEVETMVALPEERDLLDALTRPEYLTLLFSAKEAIYKAIYPSVGRFFDFGAARLVSGDRKRLRFALTRDWSAEFKQGRHLEVRHARVADTIVTVVCELKGRGAFAVRQK